MYWVIFPPQRLYHHILGLTDGLTVLAQIEIVAILVHYQPSCNTSHTMKVHYETHWPTAARRCHFVLRDVSCMQSWHLSTPSHPWVPPEWPYCSSPVRTLVHCVVNHKQTSWPQVIPKYQPPICLDYRSSQTNPARNKCFFVAAQLLTNNTWNLTNFNLICWVAGMNDTSTNPLMFQVLFFFSVISCKNSLQKFCINQNII